MSTPREGPNPLRPYYRPPSIGIPQDTAGTTSSGAHGLGPKNGSAASYASSAREMFSDIDYSDYLSDSSPSSLETARKTVDEWFYLYVAILFRQPFDVAKTVLQVKSQDAVDGSAVIPDVDDMQDMRSSSYRDPIYSDVCDMGRDLRESQALTPASSTLLMTLIRTSLHTSLPPLHHHGRIRLPGRDSGAMMIEMEPECRPSRAKTSYKNLSFESQIRSWKSFPKSGPRKRHGEYGRARTQLLCIAF